MRTPPNNSAPKPPLSPAEKAAFEVLKHQRETGTKLIPKGQKQPTKKRFGKPKVAGPKPSAIKSERSGKPKAEATRSVIRPESSEAKGKATEVHQALGKGRSRSVTVEFVSQDRPSRQKPD
jgi:hypothetical protein